MERKGNGGGGGIRAHFNQALIELKTRNIIASGPSFRLHESARFEYGDSSVGSRISIFWGEKRLPLKR